MTFITKLRVSANRQSFCDISIGIQPFLFAQARGSVVVKPEDSGFEFLKFFNYLILSAALGPRFYLASNRNEYQKQKNLSGK
jgi:hypothetical protein